jgi:hypothetical protein
MELEIGQSPKVLELKAKVEALPYEKTPACLRAELAVAMVKDAVDLNKMLPQKAQKFADSLKQDCVVPVAIGTDARKVFPIEDIVDARPLTVSAIRDAADKAGMDYKKSVDIRRQKANQVISAMEMEFGRQNDAYGPFTRYLSPETAAEETGMRARKNLIAKSILSGKDIATITPEQEKWARNLVEVDVANIIYGQQLSDWLSARI